MIVKKLVSLLLAGVMTFSLAACGESGTGNAGSTAGNATSTSKKAETSTSVEEAKAEDVVSKAIANGERPAFPQK